MNHKVLLADDSLTIQKVIKITLANQPYDIVDCGTEEELFKQLPIVQPKLVFLDFNLSEKFTGYELTAKVKEILPTTKVLLLLGTFDNVDEAAMEKCGASDKIVKPFDSNKFIAISKQLVDTFTASESIPYPTAKPKVEPVIPESPEDQWTVGHVTEPKFKVEEKAEEKSLPTQNPLMKEVSDWGMSIPGIINDAESHNIKVDLPPVIAPKASKLEVVKDDQKFPSNDDLDYPTMEELTGSIAPKPTTSKLISVDSFHEDKTAEFEIDHSFSTNDTDVSSIEAQIRDEVEDNLWQADEFEDLKKEVSAKIEEVKSNFQPTLNDFDESLFKPLDDKESIDWDSSSDFFKSETPATAAAPMATLDKSELEEMVKKYVKEYMDEMFQQRIEKVAWEVIPDLAENLIRQELSKIANKVINE